MQKAPQRDLHENSPQAVVDFVPANLTTNKEVHDHALDTQLDHRANENAGQGQCFHPSRQQVCDPNVFHVHIALGVTILVGAHVVAHDVLIVPAHGRPDQEKAGEHAQAVDPFLLADLLVATLVRETGADSGHDASSKQTGKGRSNDEEQPHHDAPHNRQPNKRLHSHSGAAATARESLSHAFLDLLVERIWRWGGCSVSLQHLPMLVVPWVVRLEKGSAVTAAPCQNCHATTRVLIHKLMQVIAVAMDVPQVWVVGDRFCLLGCCRRRFTWRVGGACGVGGSVTLRTLGDVLADHLGVSRMMPA